MTSVLHNWGQTLEFHPHIHSIVTGGGLSNNKWIESKKEYLFKVQVLSYKINDHISRRIY